MGKSILVWLVIPRLPLIYPFRSWFIAVLCIRLYIPCTLSRLQMLPSRLRPHLRPFTLVWWWRFYTFFSTHSLRASPGNMVFPITCCYFSYAARSLVFKAGDNMFFCFTVKRWDLHRHAIIIRCSLWYTDDSWCQLSSVMDSFARASSHTVCEWRFLSWRRSISLTSSIFLRLIPKFDEYLLCLRCFTGSYVAVDSATYFSG